MGSIVVSLPDLQAFDWDNLFPHRATEFREFFEKLEAIRKVLESNEYPCPICMMSPVRHAEGIGIGTVTMDWEHETDDMGYKVSSWPNFASTCEDSERIPYTLRGSKNTTGYPRDYIPRNHGEQLNRMIEDDGSCPEVDALLGAAQERARLRKLFGIWESRW